MLKRASSGKRRIAVVGGGLTGLTAAWRLQSAGFDVKVFEKEAFVGGRTRSIHKDGFIFDVGAITMLPTYIRTYALTAELGIAAHVNKVAPIIGIPRDGRIHALDLAHPLRSLLGTALLSGAAKFRLLKLLPTMIRAWRKATYETLSTLREWDHESIADFVRRECGEEILEYIAGPIIRGNTLNSTECAPAGELLWMLRQYAAPYVLGFDSGINFLAETLGSRLPVELRAEIVSIEQRGAEVVVRGRLAGVGFADSFDALVLALPPKALLPLAPALTQRQRGFLESIVPLRSVNLHVGLRRRPPAAATFILPPRSEQPVLTTIVMDHLKASGRCAPDKGVVSFFLRDDWSHEQFAAPDAQILDDVLAMARPFLGDLRRDVESFVVQRWPYATIKSCVGLYGKMSGYEADIDTTGCVQIGGDFLSLGMEGAVISGTTTAARLVKYFAAETAPH